MNDMRIKAGLVLLAVLGAGTATADNNYGLGVKAGTLGIGVEGIWRPLPLIDIRLGLNGYDYDENGFQAGVNYDATLALDTLYATANFHFPVSPFRVTAGVFANGNELRMVSSDNTNFDIGGDIYTAADVGTLSSVTSFADTAPYVGIGFDFSVFGKVGLNLDVGVLWQGEPDVVIDSDGLLANDPGFQSALETERLELVDEMSDFKAWPVISLGFLVNF